MLSEHKKYQIKLEIKEVRNTLHFVTVRKVTHLSVSVIKNLTERESYDISNPNAESTTYIDHETFLYFFVIVI